MHALAWIFWLVGAQSYERYVAPQSLPPDERTYAHVVRSFAHRHHQRVHYDWRLMRAAKAFLEQHETSPAPMLNIATLRELAQQSGWTDGELSAVMVTSRAEALPLALDYELEQVLGDTEANAMGLASLRGHEATAVVLLSRRLVRLSPVPIHVGLGRRVHLVGSRYHGATSMLKATLRCPDGTIVSTPLPMHHGRFATSVGVGTTPGVLQVELLAERGAGPEVAANFPVQVQAQTAAQEEFVATTHHSGARTAQEPNAAELVALVWSTRLSHGLPLPALDVTLTQVAQEHAMDMAENHFFAHVSPTTGDAGQRLKAAHAPFLHLVENIAQDLELLDGYGQWLASPGHLANLLDTRVSQMGVGLAHVQHSVPKQWIMVLLMSLPPK